MKFTKRIIVMTFLAVTAVVSTGFAYDYVCITLSTIATLTHNTTPITIRTILTMQHPTMTTKIIAVQNSNFRGCGGYRR